MKRAQSIKMTDQDLYALGYTIAEAADLIGVTRSHLRFVIIGKRESERVQGQLAKLPKKKLTLRRCKHAV